MNKIKLIICVFVFIIIFCIVGAFFVQADTEIVGEEDVLLFQNEITNNINIYGYTFDNPNVIVDPYNENYNSALIVFETDEYASVEVYVNDMYSYNSEVTNKHYIGVYNLLEGSNKIILSYGKKIKEIDINIEEKGNSINFSDVMLLSNNHLLTATFKYLANGNYTGIREIDALGKIYFEYLIPDGYRGISCEIDEERLAVLSNDLIILDRQNGNVIDSFDISDYKIDWLGISYVNNKINLYGEDISISVDMDGKIDNIEEKYENEYFSGDINYNNKKGVRFYKKIKTETSNKKIWLLNYNDDMKENIEIKKEFNRIIVSGDNINKCSTYLILDQFSDKRVYGLCDNRNYIYTYDMEGKYSVYFKINDSVYKTNKYLKF